MDKVTDMVDKIKPTGDARISLRSAILNGYTYGYIYSESALKIPHRGTIFLVHGFPDLSFGWRYQIPLLTSLGFTVIAPDCLGYGRSDAPGTHQINAYTYKRISDDIAELCRQLNIKSIILGGHDWGGAIVYRVAQFQPTLVKALFSVCTPYQMPTPKYVPLKQFVETYIPNFRYQLHFASGELERAIRSPREIATFLHAMYGARTVESGGARGKTAFNAEGQVALELLPTMGKSKLLSDAEMDYYVQEYSRHGMNGPLNWYRSREAMFLDDLDFFYDGPKTDAKKVEGKVVKIEQPCLFVFATRDTALQEWMSKNMEERIPRLTRRSVEAGHWALWEKPAEVNAMIKDWLEGLLGNKTVTDLPSLTGGKAKL